MPEQRKREIRPVNSGEGRYHGAIAGEVRLAAPHLAVSEWCEDQRELLR